MATDRLYLSMNFPVEFAGSCVSFDNRGMANFTFQLSGVKGCDPNNVVA